MILLCHIILFVDIDECSDNPCDTNAACKNSDGSYECTCNDGWTGDGDTCAGMFIFFITQNSIR